MAPLYKKYKVYWLCEAMQVDRGTFYNHLFRGKHGDTFHTQQKKILKEAIQKSTATIVYVCNIMSQNGETDGYSVEDHVDALEKILEKSIDRVIVNKGKIDEDIVDRYKEEKSFVVECKSMKDNYEFYDLVEIKDGKVRHNSNLAKKIILGQ